MYCINCWNEDTKVIDSRSTDEGDSIRRRRECENCQYRFTTFEKIELINLVVVKTWNKKQKYVRGKLEDSLLKATNKRNISVKKINDLIKGLEYKWNTKSEVTTKDIWADVLEALSWLDEVAYIRYASVHHKFETAKDFMQFIAKNLEK
jgi:transcriptional repressor NrdR